MWFEPRTPGLRVKHFTGPLGQYDLANIKSNINEKSKLVIQLSLPFHNIFLKFINCKTEMREKEEGLSICHL